MSQDTVKLISYFKIKFWSFLSLKDTTLLSKQSSSDRKAVWLINARSQNTSCQKGLFSFKSTNLGTGLQKKYSLFEAITFLWKTYEKTLSNIFKPESMSKFWFHWYKWGAKTLLDLRKATFLALLWIIFSFWKHDSEYCMHTRCQLILSLGARATVWVIWQFLKI